MTGAYNSPTRDFRKPKAVVEANLKREQLEKLKELEEGK